MTFGAYMQHQRIEISGVASLVTMVYIMVESGKVFRSKSEDMT